MRPRPPMPSWRSPPISPSCAALRAGRAGRARQRTGPRRPRYRRPQLRRRRRARAYAPVRKTPTATSRCKLKIAPGARLVFADGTPDILAYPQDRAAWGRLTRLLTVGKSRAEKGDCILGFRDLLDYIEGLNLIVMPPSAIDADALVALLARLKAAAARAIGLARGQHALSRRRPPPAGEADRDRRRRARAADRRQRRALSCARTPGAAGRRHLHPRARDPGGGGPPAGSQCRAASEIRRRDGAAVPRSIQRRSRRRRAFSNAAVLAGRTARHRISGRNPQGLCHAAGSAGRLRRRRALQHALSERHAGRHVRDALDKELAIIGELKYAPYFLTVHDIVQFRALERHPLPGPRLGGQFA